MDKTYYYVTKAPYVKQNTLKMIHKVTKAKKPFQEAKFRFQNSHQQYMMGKR